MVWGGVINIVLVPGMVFDDFGFEGGTRALSATPLFWVTGASLALDVRREGGRVLVRQGGRDLALRPRSVLQGLPGFFRWALLDAHGAVVARRSVDVCSMFNLVFIFDVWGFFGVDLIDSVNPRTPTASFFLFGCGDPLTTHA